jgi:hypothetical protein
MLLKNHKLDSFLLPFFPDFDDVKVYLTICNDRFCHATQHDHVKTDFILSDNIVSYCVRQEHDASCK